MNQESSKATIKLSWIRRGLCVLAEIRHAFYYIINRADVIAITRGRYSGFTGSFKIGGRCTGVTNG